MEVSFQKIIAFISNVLASLTLLYDSYSANTLRSFTYWPVIPQQSMSSLSPVQPHHCPLLSQFPNLTDVRIYSVCCPDIFKSFFSPQTDTPSDQEKPVYNTLLPRKWKITIPRVLKSIARGCRDVSQEEEPFWSNGPHDTDHEQAKAEWLLKTPSWGLVWSQASLLELVSAARSAQQVLGQHWDLEITFEGMVAVESSAYANGVSGTANGIYGGRYTGFDGYQGLFPSIPSGSLDYRETIFYPLKKPSMVKIVAQEMGIINGNGSEDDNNGEDEEYGFEEVHEKETHRLVKDDGVRIAWKEEAEFLDLGLHG